MSVNKVILIGNLGRDPEIKALNNGRKVASFSLATNETYKNRDGQKQTNTEWHNIVFYSPLAEIAESYLKKGSQVYIEGKITYRQFDDKDGNKRYITEIVGRELTMLGRAKADTTEEPVAPPEDENEQNFDFSENMAPDEDLPF
ncbi:MAG: single-stranded DNA-binding protein [Marinilabiliales bacterium]